MTKEELKIVLEKHQKWFNEEEGGEFARLCGADLRGVDLHDINLFGIDLRGVDLRDANLRNADLRLAKLQGADLRNADLHDTDLRGARLYRAYLDDTDLRSANLRYADLCGAYLRGADLSYKDLRQADLRGAMLYTAKLSCADLRGAKLGSADLSCADLSCADLRGASLCSTRLDDAELFGVSLDDKERYRLGTILKRNIIGYKKLSNGTICKLEIPKGAVVFCINGSDCRTNIAKVLKGEGASFYNTSFVYKEGKTIEIDDFDLRYNSEWANGIHFFKTKKEAKEFEPKFDDYYY